MKTKRVLSLLLTLIIILSSFPINMLISVFAGTSPYDSTYGKGTYSDPVDYRKIYPKEFVPNGATAPISKFSIINKANGSTIATSADDNTTVTKVDGVPIGTTIKIYNLSTVGSGNTIDMVDFQVTKGGSLVKAIQAVPSALDSYELTLNSTGTYNFYLCVRDDTHKSKTDGWGNWSYNGAHQATGLNYGINDKKETTGTPEIADGDDFWGYWYYTQIQINVTSDATAIFTINYNNNNITDNKDNPLLKSSTNRTLVLQDESVQGTIDSIISRTWYYWDVANKWVPLAGKAGVSIPADGTTATINDYDSNLPNSNSTSKAFKLETRTQSGYTASCEHTVYFRYGSVTIYYKDVDTNADLFAASYNGNLMAGTQSISAKAAPSGYTLLTSSPQNVTLDQNNPDKAVTFFYKKGSAVPGTGTIIVQYKNKKNPSEDVLSPDNSRTDVPYGTYTITAEPAPSGYVFDSSTPSPQTVVLNSSNSFTQVTFYYMPVSSSQGKPPIAIITGPSERMAGESITFSGGSSIDPDGIIVDYIWNIPGSNHVYTDLSKKTTKVWYPHPGEYDLDLTVVDNDGLTGDCMTYINITPPVPTAIIDITGKLKENRKVTVSGAKSSSPHYYPINRYAWTMTNSSDARYESSFGSETSKDMIFKKAQPYIFTLNVSNTYGLSDSDTSSISILPDIAPISDFSVATQVTRNPNDSNYSEIVATNLSRSTDGDAIKKTVMFYAYDSDNDGNFDEETWYYSKDGTLWAPTGLSYSQLNTFDLYNLNCGNPGTFTLKTKEVGRYKFEAMTIEDIPAEDTIPSLLSPRDYKTGITITTKPQSAKIVEVMNTAPTAGFEIKKKKPLDLVIVTDYSSTKMSQLQSQLTVLETQLRPLNIDIKTSIITNKVPVATQTARKFKYYRDLHFIRHIEYADGTNYSVSPPGIFQDLGFRLDENVEYEKPASEIPPGVTYYSYSFLRNYSYSNASSEGNGVEYRVYHSNGYTDVSCPNYSNTNGSYRNYLRWHIESVYADPTYKVGEYLGTDTFTVYNMDVDGIKNIQLRENSDRYVILLSDGKAKDYSKEYGESFSVGNLTEGLKSYIESNKMKVYAVLDTKFVNSTLLNEIIVDIQADGNMSMQRTAAGDVWIRHADFGTYKIDESVSGRVKCVMNPNLVIFESGGVKYFHEDTLKTFPVSNVTAVGFYESTLLAASGGTFYVIDTNSYSIIGIYTGFDKITSFHQWEERVNSAQKNTLLVFTEGQSYKLTDTDSSGNDNCVFESKDKFMNGYSIKEFYYFNYNTVFFLTYGNSLYKYTYEYDGAANKYVYKLTFIDSNIKEVSFTTGNWGRTAYRSGDFCYNMAYLKNDGTVREDYPVVISQRKEREDDDWHWVNVYGNTGFKNVAFPAAVRNLAGFRLYTYAVGNDNNMYKISGGVSALECSNVKSISSPSPSYLFCSRLDGRLHVKYYYINVWGNVSTSENTLSNVKKYAVTNTKSGSGYMDSALYLYDNGTTSMPVIPNNITLSNTTIKYITVNEFMKGSPDNKLYGAGQYAEAINDIISSYKADPSYSTNYILLNDEVEIKTFYSDYENDQKYREYWSYSHDPYYYDNSLGIADFHGKTYALPITEFNKVGKFQVDLKVRDNPKDNNAFDSYRLYNKIPINANLYVHRRPIALTRVNVAPNGALWHVQANDAGSYDSDHASRADKGIAEAEWGWREQYDTVWHNERMNKYDCEDSKVYYIRHRVKDLEGVWSDYDTIQIDKDNPPVALFTIEKPVIATTEYLKVKDSSYSQSFSTITDWHWIVNKVNADGSETNIYSKKATESNTGSGALSGYDTNVKYSYGSTGRYRIYLRVKNSNGIWSDGGTDAVYTSLDNFCGRDIYVDSLPIAGFTIEKNPIFVEETIHLRDTSASTGISPLSGWHWIVKKLNEDGSEPVESIQDGIFADSNNGSGSMAGYDVNVKTLYADKGPGIYRIYLRVMNGNSMWSDFFSEKLEVQESFKMSNFRVVKVKDLHLESYYFDPATGDYKDRPMNVNSMAVDYQNFGGIVDGLTKGYLFEFEIDTVNFNDANDTIEITPRFYTCDNFLRDSEERDLFWENSYHEILKTGEGGHSPWASICLTAGDRRIGEGNHATWRGSYLIPGTAWAVPGGTSRANAAASRINRDIIVSFEIKGYKDGVEKFDYNLKQWPLERTVLKHPYEIGDVIRYSHGRSNLEDNNVIINRP